jgi:3-phosphoshikimate 1-carboxyvinyltransferase
MAVSADMPDDVQLLHYALTQLSHSSHCERPIGVTPSNSEASDNLEEVSVKVGNCGTAMRFLTAYCAQLEGKTTILEGVERMHHRPIGQLVDALRKIGAQIEYLGEEGFPPLRIKGCALDKHRMVTINNPLSTQYISALLLIGANVITNSTSPYIDITQEVIKQYHLSPFSFHLSVEKDWSSAAFWYEYVAIYGGEIHLPGLFRDSLQGDKVVADIFVQLGVHTTYTPEGVRISGNGYRESITNSEASNSPHSGRPIAAPAASNCKILEQDFATCPDLYPAVALACERLGVELQAIGTESLTIKESNRLRAVREHRTEHDHRMAMALLIAGYEVDDTECIKKSYPQFLRQWQMIQNS